LENEILAEHGEDCAQWYPKLAGAG
jgi:hypothetical protein